jgi:triosephosphate isomerase (TIM)
MQQFLYVANWKMNMPIERARSFYQHHAIDLKELQTSTHAKIVLCPSFIVLGALSEQWKQDQLLFGAQDSSAQVSGAFTGQVDAVSLAQIGCSYCIVGHSERRQYFHEDDTLVAQKVAQLQLNHIIPIVCIGETEAERSAGLTYEVLRRQLAPVLTVTQATQGLLYIGYEPVWAIGSGKVPAITDIAMIISWLRTLVCKELYDIPVHYLYGGGITPETSASFKTVPGLDGFLIGAASTDFQLLKKIVL